MRYVALALPTRLLRLLRQLPPRTLVILSWGGLRRGISLALGLSASLRPEVFVPMTFAVGGAIFIRYSGAYVEISVGLAQPNYAVSFTVHRPSGYLLYQASPLMAALLHYFANVVGSVAYVPEDGYLLLHWPGVPMTGPEFRALYVHTHNLLLRNHLRGILADHRAWLLATWLPQAVAETEFSRYAVLPTLDPSHRLHTGAVKEEIRRTVTTEFFEEVALAAAWLRAA